MSVRKPLLNPMVAGIIAGIVIALIVGVMAKINIDFAAPWASTHTMTAQIHDADGIGVSSDVRIAGRLVGQVTAVHSRGSYSDVTFHIDNAEWPLPQDSTASIRLATLLGQKYVEIQPGTDAQHVYADNAIIPQSKTKDVVDFDQILKGFDTTTLNHLTALIRTVGGAVQGQEGTIQVLVPDLRDLSVHSTTGTGELAARDSEFNNILINLGVTADQLGQSRDDFAGTIDNLNKVTGALAGNQGALRGQIRNADQLNQTSDLVLSNGAAGQFNAGLLRFNGVAHQLDDLLTQLVPRSVAFKTNALEAAINLIYRIGDATSQSDKYGYFLRQNLQTIDCTGLAAACTILTTGKAPQAAKNSQGNGASPIPIPVPVPLPPLVPPIIQPPTLPPLPTLPPVPGLQGGNGGGGGTCLLGILCPPGTHAAWDYGQAQISLADLLFGTGA